MKQSLLLKIAGFGLFISAAILFEYSDFSLLTNLESYVIASVALLLFFLSIFLKPVKNIQTANFILNALIIFLFIFIVINIIIIIEFHGKTTSYGWIFVSICYIIAYFLMKRSNLQGLKK